MPPHPSLRPRPLCTLGPPSVLFSSTILALLANCGGGVPAPWGQAPGQPLAQPRSPLNGYLFPSNSWRPSRRCWPWRPWSPSTSLWRTRPCCPSTSRRRPRPPPRALPPPPKVGPGCRSGRAVAMPGRFRGPLSLRARGAVPSRAGQRARPRPTTPLSQGCSRGCAVSGPLSPTAADCMQTAA